MTYEKLKEVSEEKSLQKTKNKAGGGNSHVLQNNTKKKIRNSSIELLRIIAMMLIVFHHFAVHGGFTYGTSLSVTHFWYNFIIMGGKIGVDVFVLISGYYLITNKDIFFNINRIMKFLGQVFFYSVSLFVICGLTGLGDFTIKSFIKSLFPITFSKWWFASTYFVLYLLHPFINKLLNNIEKTLYQKLLILLVICWSIIPTFTGSLYQGNGLLWFITLYSMTGYIRLYGLNKKFTGKHYCVFFILCVLLTYASSIVFTLLGNRWSTFEEHNMHFYGQEKITIFVISLSLFMIFETLKMNCHRWINIVAGATFGVYLIHDHSDIRKFLWIDLFQNAHYQDSLFLIPYSIIVVLIVYIACSCIDLLRQFLIEKPFMIFIKSYSEKITNLFKKGIVLLSDFVFGK